MKTTFKNAVSISFIMERKFFGISLIFISIILFIFSLFSVKITGAITGFNLKNSFLIILVFVFFFLGLLILISLEKRILNYAKTIVLAGAINSGASQKAGPVNERPQENKNEKKIENIKNVKPLSSWKTTQGKFERTYRWDGILDKVEKKYDIPQGLLKGLAMRESYGDPLRLNESDDGGAGLFMFQPGTAQEYGLKVYGSSKKTTKDTIHGKELKKLIKKNNYDYKKMAQIDERFDVKKSSDVAGAYLKKKYKKYNSWDKALSAYNLGRSAKNPLKTEHVKKVRRYQNYYNKRDKN